MVNIQLFQVNSERLVCIHPPFTCVPESLSTEVVAFLVLAVAEPLVGAVAALALGLHRRLRPVKSGVSVCWRLLCKVVFIWFSLKLSIYPAIQVISYRAISYQAITCLYMKLSFLRIVP